MDALSSENRKKPLGVFFQKHFLVVPDLILEPPVGIGVFEFEEKCGFSMKESEVRNDDGVEVIGLGGLVRMETPDFLPHGLRTEQPVSKRGRFHGFRPQGFQECRKQPTEAKPVKEQPVTGVVCGNVGNHSRLRLDGVENLLGPSDRKNRMPVPNPPFVPYFPKETLFFQSRKPQIESFPLGSGTYAIPYGIGRSESEFAYEVENPDVPVRDDHVRLWLGSKEFPHGRVVDVQRFREYGQKPVVDGVETREEPPPFEIGNPFAVYGVEDRFIRSIRKKFRKYLGPFGRESENENKTQIRQHFPQPLWNVPGHEYVGYLILSQLVQGVFQKVDEGAFPSFRFQKRPEFVAYHPIGAYPGGVVFQTSEIVRT